MSGALIALVALGLGWAARAHPGLRFPDFIGFSARAAGLPERWIDELYPVGYPLLLRALHPLVGDSLTTGRTVSVLAGVGAALAARALGGPVAIAALMAVPAFVAAGSTEGTDLLAAALCLGAFAAADRGRAGWAGVMVGLGCLTRYTAVAAVIPLIGVCAARGLPREGRGLGRVARFIGCFVAITALHGIPAVLAGQLLPGLGPHEVGSPLERLPRGLWAAILLTGHEPVAILGALGLVVGGRRRPALALGLGAWAGLHLAILGLYFSNPRLALPVWVALAPGVALLVGSLPGWGARVGGAIGVLAGVGLGGAIVRQEARITAAEAAIAVVVAEAGKVDCPGRGDGGGAGSPGERGRPRGSCWFSNNPWFHVSRDGWLSPSVQITSLGPPGSLDAAALRARMTTAGPALLALDPGRRPGVRTEPLPEGYRLLARPAGWRLLSVDP